jgi:hypothetical protein
MIMNKAEIIARVERRLAEYETARREILERVEKRLAEHFGRR